MTTARRVAAARRWFRLLGHAPITHAGATIIAAPWAPDVWDANFVTADEGADPTAVIAALDAQMGHSRWRVINADVLNDAAFEAAIALADFRQGAPIIEMLASGPVASSRPLPPIAVRPVSTEADWHALAALVRIDHAEGKRTGELSDTVGEGLIEVMRRRAPPSEFLIIALDGSDVGYGMIVACPGGLGLIESLFTIPQARGQGVMSAFIVTATDRLRAQGCDGIFLDAHAEDRPKQLYASLGFEPVAIARRWARQIPLPRTTASRYSSVIVD